MVHDLQLKSSLTGVTAGRVENYLLPLKVLPHSPGSRL